MGNLKSASDREAAKAASKAPTKTRTTPKPNTKASKGAK